MKLSSALASLTIVALVVTLVVRPDIVFWMVVSLCVLSFILFTQHVLTEFFDWLLPDRFDRW